MRLLALVAIALLIAAPAQAASGPKLRPNTPYPDARKQLIAQGFDPVTILGWGDVTRDCEEAAFSDLCQRYREVAACAHAGGGRSPCMFLYRHRATGAYWMIHTDGLPTGEGGDMGPIRFRSAAPASPWLSGLTVRVGAAGAYTFD